MFTNKKIAPYIFAFLAFCVVSSKHIIIYNEEILVALSFLFFVIFVSYYFGNNIKESLDERSTVIQSELQNFLTLKKNCLNELFKEYKKASFSKQILQNLTNFTKLQLKNKSKNSEKALKTIFSQQTNHKLRNLSYANFNLKTKLQRIISDELLTAVLVKSKKLKTKNNTQNKPELNFNVLKQGIQALAK
jgi:F0F1-type ATP synthase membrane subunit b/b'